MMSKKSPQLRFEGFTDDWEESKFGELYKKMNEKNDLSFGKDRVISVANMYFKDTGNIRSDDAYMKTYNIFRTGDIAFEGNRSKHFAYGRFVENTIGDGIVSHVFDVFRPIQQFDLNYWKYAIHNERVMGPILMTATTSSTMMTNLVAKDFLKRAILVPSYSEQKLVGSFFKQLDDTIALHQRKLDLLKEQKKGYLQKMFPKNGAKVPELRFAGFADDWEQRKLGDISYKVKEKNKTGEFTETLTNSAEYGIINQRDFFDKDISNAKNLTGYYVVKNDDFVYNPRISNFAPVGPIKRNKLGRTGVMSPLYYVFRTHDIDKNYFEKYFDTVYWHRFMELNGDSGARADRFAIKDSVFVEMPIPYPTMDEQQKIGSFFKQLDDTIALHQCKLDLLKEQKKGFLQKMFV
ncbi:MAG: restriction endonuclease subunit S [Lactococcus chungangensis]